MNYDPFSDTLIAFSAIGTVRVGAAFIRHIQNMEFFAGQSIEASTMSFKDLIMAPIQFL